MLEKQAGEEKRRPKTLSKARCSVCHMVDRQSHGKRRFENLELERKYKNFQSTRKAWQHQQERGNERKVPPRITIYLQRSLVIKHEIHEY